MRANAQATNMARLEELVEASFFAISARISDVVHCALVDEMKVIMTRTKRRAIATN